MRPAGTLAGAGAAALTPALRRCAQLLLPRHRTKITAWWETKEDARPLIIGQDAKQALFPSFEFPEQLKNKAVYVPWV